MHSLTDFDMKVDDIMTEALFTTSYHSVRLKSGNLAEFCQSWVGKNSA